MTVVALALLVALGLVVYSLVACAGRASREEERRNAAQCEREDDVS